MRVMKRRKQLYLIQAGQHYSAQLTPVFGRPVELEGFENIFIHRPLRAGSIGTQCRGWAVSESTTGLYIVSRYFYCNQAYVISEARDRLNKQGKDNFNRAIRKALEVLQDNPNLYHSWDADKKGWKIGKEGL